jgi:hypothetical protein
MIPSSCLRDILAAVPARLFLNNMLEEKPAHHPLEPLDVALKHTGWMPPAYLYSLAESAKVEGKRIVNSDII